MQIHQIFIRPESGQVIVLYLDQVGNRSNLTFEVAESQNAQAVIAECQGKLPSDEEHPDKDEIEQEIEELEYRLTQLKESIGAA